MLSVALIAALTLGQSPTSDRNCRDDNGTDRCAAENHAALLDQLGMRSIEQEQADGVEVYRTLQIDGYGRPLAGVAFERRVGASPQVVVYGPNGARMAAQASVADWRRIQSDAVLADRQLVPLAADPNEIGLCLHAWVSTVEIANAAERGAPDGKVRRRTENACGAGLTSRFAFDLAARALKAFPDCDALDPDDHRNDATRLRTCVGFKGDRLAAAELMNQIGQTVGPDNDQNTPLAWMRSLGGPSRIAFDWGGQKIDGRGTYRNNPVVAFLVDQKAQHPSLRGYMTTLDAVSSTQVEVGGYLHRDGEGDQRVSATFRQTWAWDRNTLNWELESWTVEPFRPVN